MLSDPTGRPGQFLFLLVSIVAALVLFNCDNFTLYDELDVAQNSADDSRNDSQNDAPDGDDPVPAPLSISPAVVAIRITETVGFAGSGGEPAYVFSITGGIGAIDALSGLYTAPATVGAASVQIADAAGDVADASVTVVAPSELRIYPETITVQVDTSYTFSGAGGITPYTFTMVSNPTGATISAAGLYTAGSVSGTDVVRLTDTAGAQVAASITVVQSGPLGISPVTPSIAEGSAIDFSAYGGTPPYSFSITDGDGAIVAGTGFYSAPASVGTDVSEVTITDSNSDTVSTTVTVVPAAPTDSVADGTYAGNATIELTWTDNSDAEDGYIIERKEIGESFDPLNPLIVVGPNTTGYVDSLGSPNVLYIYRIRAYTDSGLYSAYSSEAYDFSNS